jgi:hypothetical protein
MEDESKTPQEEEEVEGHIRPRSGPEEPGRHFRNEENEDDEVEGHIRPRSGPERHF